MEMEYLSSYEIEINFNNIKSLHANICNKDLFWKHSALFIYLSKHSLALWLKQQF